MTTIPYYPILLLLSFAHTRQKVTDVNAVHYSAARASVDQQAEFAVFYWQLRAEGLPLLYRNIYPEVRGE